MNRTKRRLSGAVVAALLACLLAACSDTSDDSSGDVKIGGTYPLTGPLGTDGQEMVNAIKLAVQDVNEAGGILDGRDVSFDALDSEGTPEKAQSNIQALIDDGSVALIGAWLSSNTLATTQVAERAAIPHMVDQSLARELTERGFKYTFRVQFDPVQLARTAVAQYKELLTANDIPLDVVYMHEESAFGTTCAEEFVKEAEANGIEVADVIAYPTTTTDLSAEVARAIATDASALVHTGYGPDSLVLLRTLEEQGADFAAVLGNDNAGWAIERFADQAGDTVDGVFNVTYGNDRKSPEYQEFIERYLDEFGTAPSDQAATSYTTARVLIDAIDQAGTTDPDKVRQALVEGTFDHYLLAQESITFGEDGQNEGANPVLYQWQTGSLEVVGPPEYATAEPDF